MKNIIWIEQDVSTGGFITKTLPHAIEGKMLIFLTLKDTEAKRDYINKVFKDNESVRMFQFLFFKYIPYLYYIYLPFLVLKRLHKKINETEFIFVESPTFACLSGVILKLIIRKPLVLRLGILPVEYAAFRKKTLAGKYFQGCFLRSFMRFNFKFVDYFIVDNSVIGDEIKKYKKNGHIVICPPYGIDNKLFFPIDKETKFALRERLKIPLNKTVGVYAGRLSVEKGGLLNLINLAKELEKRGVIFYIIGHGGLQQSLQELARQAALKNIVFLGFMPRRENVVEYIQSADFYIQPSLAEGHGIAPLEAMACKIPVVSTTVGGLRLTITEDRAFPVEDANNLDAYRKAMNSFLTADISVKQNKIENAYRYVGEHFSQEVIEQKWKKIIDSFN